MERQMMNNEELEQVAGGTAVEGTHENCSGSRKCKKCGQEITAAQHEKTLLPPILSAKLQKEYEQAWCGDCIHEYWEKYGKGLERFKN